MPKRIFITRKLPGDALERLDHYYEVDVWESENPPTQDDILARGKECIGLVTLLSDKVNEDLIKALPNLKIISQYAVGYNNIDIQAATKRGIMVTNTPGVLTEATADLTWALILAVARRISESDRYVRDAKWNVAWGPEMLLGVDVFGSTLGIIGMGRIGYSVTKRAAGFNMRILYHSRSVTDLTKKAQTDFNAECVPLSQLLAEADIISIHVPLTKDTRYLINKNTLSQMKPSAILVNTSRGPVVNEDDLFQALKEKRILGAGLDVFETEPTLNTNPLLSLDNVVVLPHIGSATIKTRKMMADIVVENLVAGLTGELPPNIVNPEMFE